MVLNKIIYTITTLVSYAFTLKQQYANEIYDIQGILLNAIFPSKQDAPGNCCYVSLPLGRPRLAERW